MFANDVETLEACDVSLSPRERTVVVLMSDGLSNKQIARQLCVAPDTVKWHAANIFWKLAVRNRAQAVYRAATLGLIGLQQRREHRAEPQTPAIRRKPRHVEPIRP